MAFSCANSQKPVDLDLSCKPPFSIMHPGKCTVESTVEFFLNFVYKLKKRISRIQKQLYFQNIDLLEFFTTDNWCLLDLVRELWL